MKRFEAVHEVAKQMSETSQKQEAVASKVLNDYIDKQRDFFNGILKSLNKSLKTNRRKRR